MTAKPTVEELGIDVGAQRWQRRGATAEDGFPEPGRCEN